MRTVYSAQEININIKVHTDILPEFTCTLVTGGGGGGGGGRGNPSLISESNRHPKIIMLAHNVDSVSSWTHLRFYWIMEFTAAC